MKVNPEAIIIIFGAAVRPDGQPSMTLRKRVEAAAGFGGRFNRPLFIPTGGQGRHGDPEACVMARLLVASGFAETTIALETTATDTVSSVRAIARMLRTIPSAPVYACTSAYHLPRCRLLMRLAGIKTQACPPPRTPAATSAYDRWYWRLREVPALPYDAMLILWHRATGQL
jgi:uncharacterized SAM-binding protein YcdF (DUF218 family)